MSDTGFTNEGLAVRACRGHFHVTVGGCDLALPGDPYKTREAALDVALSEAVATVAALTAENERLTRDLATARENYDVMHASWKGLHWELDQLRAAPDQAEGPL